MTSHEAQPTSTEREIPGVVQSRSHANTCEWHHDQYDHECDCGVLVRDGAATLVIGSLRYHALLRACQHAREMDWPGDVDVLQRMIDVAVPAYTGMTRASGR